MSENATTTKLCAYIVKWKPKYSVCFPGSHIMGFPSVHWYFGYYLDAFKCLVIDEMLLLFWLTSHGFKSLIIDVMLFTMHQSHLNLIEGFVLSSWSIKLLI